MSLRRRDSERFGGIRERAFGWATCQRLMVFACRRALTRRRVLIIARHTMPVHRGKEHSSQQIPEQSERGK